MWRRTNKAELKMAAVQGMKIGKQLIVVRWLLKTVAGDLLMEMCEKQ